MQITRNEIKSLIKNSMVELKESVYGRPRNDFRQDDDSIGMSDEDRGKIKWEDLKRACDESDEFYIEILKMLIDERDLFICLLGSADDDEGLQEDFYSGMKRAEERSTEDDSYV